MRRRRILFLNDGHGAFRDVAAEAGSDFAAPKVARGIAYGDFDRDGDVDLLITTNRGPALLYRNDLTNKNRSVRLRLVGTKSNRDGIGAVVRLFDAGGDAVANGEDWVELFIAVGTDADVRDRQAREGGSGGDRLAQRRGGGV